MCRWLWTPANPGGVPPDDWFALSTPAALMRAVASVCLGLALCAAGEVVGSADEGAYQRGMQLASAGQFEAARQEFETALRVQPRNPLVLNALGATCVRTGDLQRARQLFAQALDVAPDFTPARKNLALSYFSSGEHDLAMPHLRELARDDQSRPFALLLLGMIAEARSEHEEAVEFFRDARQFVSQHPQATLSFAHALFEIGEPREAVQTLDALSRIPATAGDHRRAGLLALSNGEYETAVGHFVTAGAIDGARSPADYHHALALHRLDRNKEAKEILVALAAVQPDGPALNLLGHVARQLGDAERAVESFKAAAELEPDAEEHYLDLSTLCLEYENPQLALEIVDVGIRRLPHSHRLLVQKGVLLARLGRPEESAEALRAAMGRNPGESAAAASLAMLQIQSQQLDAAIRTLTEAIKAFPDDFYLHYGYGLALRMVLRAEGEQTARWDMARQALERAIELNPEFDEAPYELGRVLEDRDAAAAAEAYAAVLGINPGHTSAKYRLGRLYIAMGRQAEGQKLLDEVALDLRARSNDEKKQRVVVEAR